MDHWVSEGIRLLKAGKRLAAERALRIAVSENERNVEAWLWLSQAVETDAEKMTCLLKVMDLDPRNLVGRQQLAALQQHGRDKDVPYVSPFRLEDTSTVEPAPAVPQKDTLFPADAEIELNVKSRRVVKANDVGRILLVVLIVLVVAVVVAALFLLIR